MVSFSCEVCNDTIIKKKLDLHTRQCRGAYFSCIDCSTTFHGQDHKNHTQCISEAQKYEKSLYKGPKKKEAFQNNTKPVNKVEIKEEVVSKEQAKPKFDLSKYTGATESLYKIVKKVGKDQNLKQKDILKSLKLVKNSDGTLSVTL